MEEGELKATLTKSFGANIPGVVRSVASFQRTSSQKEVALTRCSGEPLQLLPALGKPLTEKELME